MEELKKLIERAQKGDHTALPALKKALDADPNVWRQSGDLARQAEAAWLTVMAGKDLMRAEVVKRKMRELRKDLGGPNPSRLELLLVERIVACWLQVHYADQLFAERLQHDLSAASHKELLRRQESSQRRYLAAIKDLTLIRKLVRPPISPIDLANRPVNEGKPTRESTRAGVSDTIPFRRTGAGVATPTGLN